MFPTRSNGDPGVSGFPKSKNFRGVSSDASDAMRKKAVPEVQPPVLFPLSEKRTGTVTWTEGRPTHSAPEAFPIRITVEVLAARSAIIERDGGGSATLALPCLALPCLALPCPNTRSHAHTGSITVVPIADTSQHPGRKIADSIRRRSCTHAGPRVLIVWRARLQRPPKTSSLMCI